MHFTIHKDEWFEDYYEINIASGSTGSGKSVVEAGVIYNLVNRFTPDELEIEAEEVE